MKKKSADKSTDVVLIGAGIMSATLGVLLKEVKPDLKIQIFERLDASGLESSSAWNNAGTGHAAYCELNYTPEKNGTVDPAKAVSISEQFEVSKQFWASLVEQGKLKNTDFINTVPHFSFVHGESNVKFLKKRFDAMFSQPMFKDMVYSEDIDTLKEWFPLMMGDRDPSVPVAATRMDLGTDVNFGKLTTDLIAYLKTYEDVTIHYNCDVKDIEREGKGWEVEIKDLKSGKEFDVEAAFVFIGAGGGALPLLSKTGIPEVEGYGGFPVGGQWLRCKNEEVIKNHDAKVYGKAAIGAPPMSVPHLDSRVIDGKKELLFGPFAGFSTKFLKEGTFWDLPGSINLKNIVPMMQAGWSNMSLTRYLIQQVMLKPEERVEVLKEFYPNAKLEDWDLEIAGQRVQIIKKGKDGKGTLEFGTEIVSAKDGSVAALLGASPGASTSVSAMLTVIEKCFGKEYNSEEWQARFKNLIPTFGKELNKDEALLAQTRKYSSEKLGL